jgi:hypothetical protein
LVADLHLDLADGGGVPILEKRIGQDISGLQRDDGGIEWTLGRNRGLSL